MRQNTTDHIKDYLTAYNANIYDSSHYIDYAYPTKILDIGCSVGISTEHFRRTFPQAKIWGLDLSSYFLSVAKFRANNNNLDITYVHDNAENMRFSDNFFKLITCNFLFHEVPLTATKTILKETFRILNENGVIAIADLEPEVVNKDKNGFLTPFRKWMFEITEPHIFSYYDNPMKELLLEAGFTNIIKARNDPVNSVWIAHRVANFIKNVERYAHLATKCCK